VFLYLKTTCFGLNTDHRQAKNIESLKSSKKHVHPLCGTSQLYNIFLGVTSSAF